MAWPARLRGVLDIRAGLIGATAMAAVVWWINAEHGAFGAVWGLRREFKRKLLSAGTTYSVMIVDENGETLATAPFMVDKASKKKKGKKKK